MPKVVLLSGEFAGREVQLNPGKVYTLGRQEDCDIVVDNVAGVSRHHASFRMDGKGWIVEDNGSQNGIFCNEQKILRRELQPGDVLWFSTISVRFVDEAAPTAAAPVGAARVAAPAAPFDPGRVKEVGSLMAEVGTEFGKVIVGQRQVLKELLVALLSSGHCLMIGLPGLAKTLMIKTLADVLDLRFKRIQFTPDLMPSDIIGSDVLEMDEETGKKSFRFIRGPIFTNLLLADEINRTPPKTQAALLEAMQERQVTASNHQFPLPEPFFVLATQNPLEQEGTYPLPEAQLDRFMFNIIVEYPSANEEEEIVRETTRRKQVELRRVLDAAKLLELQALVRDLPVSPHVIKYATRLTRATRPKDPDAPEYIRQHVACGAGPRSAQFLILGAKAKAVLEGNLNVSCDHVRSLALPIMRHRLFTNFTADSEGVTADDLVRRLVLNVPEPSPKDY
jgi:MoxR-like ATPase